mmetsp:Transcript_2481/g.3479  ORF Transcript_2481/g.3479 Transcript_2481/m.3479 type:complete len:151 (+) Transcript_2481:99-551(+)
MHSYQGPPSSESSLPLPPRWVVATDPTSGRVYYASPTTGETQWTPPPLPPPPQVIQPAASSAVASVDSTLANQRVPNTSSTQGLITGPLIPRVRAILASERGELCDEISPVTYKPIQPDQLPLNAQLPAIEPGRVEIRLAFLQSKLREIG